MPGQPLPAPPRAPLPAPRPRQSRLLASLTGPYGTLWRHRYLIRQLVRRDVAQRYRGSALGLAWAFVQPLLMLAVYSFLFGVVFGARWPEARSDGGGLHFSVVLFAGLIVHGLLGDTLGRAPALITGNANYVKKLVFPIEALAWVTVAAALAHMGFGLTILLAFQLADAGSLPWTILLLPLLLAPYCLFLAGLVWLLAALGVFLRDLGQVIGVLTAAVLFTAPVFFPMTALPPALAPWIFLNPLTFILEQVRGVVLWGRLPDWPGLGVYTVVAALTASTGYYVFLRLRRAFADVV